MNHKVVMSSLETQQGKLQVVRDASVKITDINGKLIYETKALGGQAIWDGFDYNGKKAASGVYLVFSANENTSFSPEAIVAKILIVN